MERIIGDTLGGGALVPSIGATVVTTGLQQSLPAGTNLTPMLVDEGFFI